MKINILGCGSAYSKDSNTSSILIEDSLNQSWLIDCGPTIPREIFKLDININAIKVIYFTHIHPDHCTGLSALLNYWNSYKRTEPLTIFCQTEQIDMLQPLVLLASWPRENLNFDIKWEGIQDQFLWKNWSIQTANTQHEISNKAISIIVEGHKIFYSGDGRPTKASMLLMNNADIGFQECASFDALDSDASHGDYQNCASLINTTGIKRLGVFHCWDEALPQIRQHAEMSSHIFVSEDKLVIHL